MNKKILQILISLILLILAFSHESYWNFTIFIVIGFLLKIVSNSKKGIIITYGLIFITNIISLLWIKPVVTYTQYILLCLVLTLLQIIPFFIFKSLSKNKITYFIISWLLVDYVLLNSFLNFPIPVIGNALTPYPFLIQWWEFTGVLGGSLWVLVINIFIFKINNFQLHQLLKIGIGIILPVSLSVIIMYNQRNNCQENKNVKFALVSTNFPCKSIKYNLGSKVLLNQMIKNTKSKINYLQEKNDAIILLWPETAITDFNSISNFRMNQSIKLIDEKLLENTNTTLITGLFLKEFYTEKSTIHPFYLHKGRFKGDEFYLYNGLASLSKESIDYRVKEKLVPFNEFLPFPTIGQYISKYVYTGPQKFSKKNNIKNIHIKNIKITPLICYESFTGDYVRKFTRKGGQIICVILNEGWYNNEKGFKISQDFAVARAIENRRFVMKISNCGITSYIDTKGNIINQFNQNTNDVLVVNPSISNYNTIYQKIGDFGFFIFIFIFIVFYSSNSICSERSSTILKRIDKK